MALPNVSANALTGILEYCRFHTAPGRSAKESRAFDKKFAKVDRATMCELASAAYYMEVEPLIDLTCKAIASSIDWSSPEAIRDAFGLPDDLTEEEKLEPIACDADDLRTRQYNNLLARKRKQLADSKVRPVGVELRFFQFHSSPRPNTLTWPCAFASRENQLRRRRRTLAL